MEQKNRIKRIQFRSAHRGTKEADLLLGPYAIQNLETMSEAELNEFEAFLEEGDNDIWDWISGAAELPNGRYARLIENLSAFRKTESK